MKQRNYSQLTAKTSTSSFLCPTMCQAGKLNKAKRSCNMTASILKMNAGKILHETGLSVALCLEMIRHGGTTLLNM